MPRNMSVVLTIAGSDSGGGAGIQADLKTMSALGVFGTSAITAVTAQNTVGVRRVDALPPEAVVAQIEAVAEDFDVAAVKIGMLANAAIASAVVRALDRFGFPHVVVDPVCVAGSGDPLLEEAAVATLRDEVVPRATILTPNVPEAALLLGRRLADEELASAANELRILGAKAVLLKGGHRSGDADDIFVDANGTEILEAERIAGNATHGTGCSLGAALASLLARGRSPREAAREAKEFVAGSIRDAMQLGKGQSNLHHFHEYYGSEGLP